MTPFKGWVVVAGAVLGVIMAAFVASLRPASECSTAQEIHWRIAAPFFMLFLAAGFYVMAAGSVAQRLTLFVALGSVMAVYVAGLALSLPDLFQTEISCAAQGMR